MNDITEADVKSVVDAIEALSRKPGVIPTDGTMKLLYAIRRLSATTRQRGTVSIENIHAADALRHFAEALSELKERTET